MSKILLIDLSGIFRQRLHVSGNKEVSDVHDWVMAKIDQHVLGNDHVGICIDMPPYNRKKIWEGYKAGREPLTEFAVGQLEEIKESIEQRGYHTFGSEGYEADDVIATLTWAHRDEHEITILTGDKDLVQLCDHENVLWRGILLRGSEVEEYDMVAVKAVFGCDAHQFGLALALAGGHDGIKGVAGIGKKKAIELAAKYSNLEILQTAIDNDPDSVPYIKQLTGECAMEAANVSWQLVQLKNIKDLDAGKLLEPIKPMEEVIEPEVVVEKAAPQTQRAMVKVDGQNWSNALEPVDIQSAMDVSGWLLHSRLFSGFQSQEAIFAAIMYGRDLGLPGAVTSLQSIHIIQGKPTLKVEAMAALVKRSGRADYLKVVETTSERCTVKTHELGDPDPDPTVVTFTIEDAKQMGLTSKDNWRKQPTVMLRWRAMAAIIRLVYPDVTMGLYATEEMEDL